MIAETVLSALFLAVYFISGKLGLSMATLNQSASPVWPPTGVALAIFLCRGKRFWPSIFIGAFLVNITTAGSVLTSLAIAAGNTLEGLAGAALIERFASGIHVFDRPKGIFKFVFFAGVLSTMVSATIGVTSLALAGFAAWQAYGWVWLTWWLGDMVGVLLIAPVIVLWSYRAPLHWRPLRALEGSALLATLVFTALLVFSPFTFFGLEHIPIGFLCLPPLLWCAFRFGTAETAFSLLLLSAIAVWGTFHGYGLFARVSVNESLILLQAFMAVNWVTCMLVAVLTSQLTERVKTSLETLSQRERELALTSAEREQLDMFASLAAHDLREPLRKISVFSDLFMAECGDTTTERGRHYLERLQQAAMRMNELIKDLYRFSKTATEEADAQILDLNEVLKEVVQDLDLLVKETKTRIDVAPLPRVNAGPVQMRELFLNIIGNGIKFRKKDQSPHISVRGRLLEQGEVEIVIEDNGIGFDNEYAEKIFKPFERLHHHSDYAGTGIGLAICQRIVDKLGGRISAYGELGGGAAFTIILPAGSVIQTEAPRT